MPRATRMLLLLALLAVAGCGRAARIEIRADNSPGSRPLNPDPTAPDESRPVDLRIYQLRGHEAFATADFDALWRDAAAVLGKDLLAGPQTVTVLPGDGMVKPRRIALGAWSKEARSLGVLALFPEPDSDRDRRRVVVSAWHADDYVLVLSGNGIAFRRH